MPFGCFVQLEGVRGRFEGLVHISQLHRDGRVKEVNEIAKRGDSVKVKVLSMTGSKLSLSMKVGIMHTFLHIFLLGGHMAYTGKQDILHILPSIYMYVHGCRRNVALPLTHSPRQQCSRCAVRRLRKRAVTEWHVGLRGAAWRTAISAARFVHRRRPAVSTPSHGIRRWVTTITKL